MKMTCITQLNYLTQGFPQWFPKRIQKPQPWLYLVYSITLSLTMTGVSMAQSLETLPPPPPLRVPKTPIPAASSEPNSPSIPINVVPPSPKRSSAIREYTFKSSTTSSPSPESIPKAIKKSNQTPQPTGTPNLYRVQVTSQDRSILSQVKAIEPLAFIRQSEGVIHAGMFPQSQQAQKRVQELEQKGISATVVPIYEGRGSNGSVPPRPIVRPYSRSQKSEVRSQK